ncbi:hypothetical protein G3I60_13445 [Streptomyces sp. SID13666]|uniref:DUF6059 family protein n=1 Tax=unclassified Streptomyces TaxID=2593676 RepID=UPI0013C15173|nr:MULTISPECIES: DUF6059 family protein [unclassified Streptomyces]NEA55123.1 hypothetical protein [Streptomyces sp. SID13666]NEA71130.1 hypothetical protein [Streptomyces sp. SID13588]
MTTQLLYQAFFSTGQNTSMRLSMSRLLRLCANVLIAYGEMYYCLPYPDVGEPAPGHPESMVRNQPFTEMEKALDRQLEGL